MNATRKILLLVPTAAQQTQAGELLAALQSAGTDAGQMIIDGNYEQVLDALTDAVVPVVVK